MNGRTQPALCIPTLFLRMRGLQSLFIGIMDTAYTAVLQVKEQATNPGTGEGGLVGQVNSYIGRNGIKILLKGVKAGAIQKVRLRYISVCDYYQENAHIASL